MATRTQNNTGRTIAIVGGGALLLWLLWAGRGWGWGKGRGSGKGNGSGGNDNHSRDPAIVWIRSGDRVEIDGVSSDLATTVARARAAGTARVFTTGDAREGWHQLVIDSLRAAGVDLYVQNLLTPSGDWQ